MKTPLVLASIFVVSSLQLGAADWKPVAPEDLALKAGRVDPKADAEVLLWDISVFDELQGDDPVTMYRHYVRLKVFSDRGAKKFEAPKIEYSRGQHVSDVGARVIQPDGQIQEIAKDAIFDRVLEKQKGTKDRAVSFAVPGVKAGSIIEYKWHESHDNEIANNVILRAAREIPVERVVYHVKPLVSPRWPYSMRYTAFNVARPEFKPETRDVYMAELHNIPAFDDEADAPPELDIQPWVLIFYAPLLEETPDQFWTHEARNLSNYFKPQIKVNGDVKSLAASITAGAKSPDEQLDRLAGYCQKKLRDLYGSEVSDVDRQNTKVNVTTADTLKRGIGTSMDIQLAFIALARASGFDAELAAVSDRELKTFDKGLTNRIFLPYLDAAVNVNDKWKLYDVSSNYLQPGKIRWQEEGVPALVLTDKRPTWIVPSITDAKDNKIARTGIVTLDEQGAIEGDMTELRTGHVAEEWRQTNRPRSVNERKEAFRQRVLEFFPGAQLENITLPDPKNLEEPVTFSFHIKMDGYATRTGKRIIFAPALFEANTQTRYASAERKYNIFYHYGWSETDDYTINTPAGFALDHAEAPAPLTFLPVGQYSVKIRAGQKLVTYHREWMFGMNEHIRMAQVAYPTLKTLFDEVHRKDSSILTLKAATATPVAEAQ